MSRDVSGFPRRGGETSQSEKPKVKVSRAILCSTPGRDVALPAQHTDRTMEAVTYLYPVAVRCDQGPEVLIDQKKKVQTYFQSKVKSDGGECEIRDYSREYILIYFKEQEAQQRVLQKNPHQVTLKDGNTFQFSVFPPEEVITPRMGSHLSGGPPTDDEAGGHLEDAGPQEENNGSPYRKRESSSDLSSSVDEDPKRPKDDSNGERKWDNNSSDVSTFYGNIQDGNSPLTEDERNTSPAESATPRNSIKHQKSTEELKENRPEIFMELTARLDKGKFSKEMQEEIKAQCPSLSIMERQYFVEITGTFVDLSAVYQLLQKNVEVAAEKLSDTPSEGTPTGSQADQVCFPSALYEYIMEIYKDEMNNIERKYKVKTNHQSMSEGSTYVRFIPEGSDSSPEKAKESFTDKVQKVMGDWSQETVDPSIVPLTFSDIQRLVTSRWGKILVIQNGSTNIILRGPRDELSQAMKALEKGDHKPARPCPRKAVTISSDMSTEIPVEVRDMDILRRLKSKEISDIEQKYNVKMEECRKNGHVLINFRAINAPPDLSPHASHRFITLLQKTFYNIEKKVISVKPDIQEERVSIVQEQLMMGGIDIVMEYSNGSVLLIGHPVHVAFAEETLNGSRHPGQTAAASGEPMDTNDTATTKEKEEPDTCPICQCEILQDKATLKCKHAYHEGCLQELMAHKPMCAICGAVYGAIRGSQPDGTMRDNKSTYHLPGYPGCGTIEIHYHFPSGTQQDNHPHPGKHFSGTSRTAYLPDNPEGRDILRLLKKAFDQRLTFTVGESRTTGATDTVTWNDIHHKTNMTGGPQGFGYPDPDYLKRVRDELKAKGVE